MVGVLVGVLVGVCPVVMVSPLSLASLIFMAISSETPNGVYTFVLASDPKSAAKIKLYSHGSAHPPVLTVSTA